MEIVWECFVWRQEGNGCEQSSASAPELSQCTRFRALHPPVLVAVIAMALGISSGNKTETEGSYALEMSHVEG